MDSLSAVDLARIAVCLSSRVARRMLITLQAAGAPVGITALCRRVGCSRGDALRYLALMAGLSVVAEERRMGLRLICLQNSPIAALMVEAARLMEVKSIA